MEPSNPADWNCPVIASTCLAVGPSVQETLMEAPPAYFLDRTANLTVGKAFLRAARMSLAVSATEMNFVSIVRFLGWVWCVPLFDVLILTIAPHHVNRKILYLQKIFPHPFHRTFSEI